MKHKYENRTLVGVNVDRNDLEKWLKNYELKTPNTSFNARELADELLEHIFKRETRIRGTVANR